MLEEIGLFDEQFFLYCEDTDWDSGLAGPDGIVCMCRGRSWIIIRIPAGCRL